MKKITYIILILLISINIFPQSFSTPFFIDELQKDNGKLNKRIDIFYSLQNKNNFNNEKLDISYIADYGLTNTIKVWGKINGEISNDITHINKLDGGIYTTFQNKDTYKIYFLYSSSIYSKKGINSNYKDFLFNEMLISFIHAYSAYPLLFITSIGYNYSFPYKVNQNNIKEPSVVFFGPTAHFLITDEIAFNLGTGIVSYSDSYLNDIKIIKSYRDIFLKLGYTAVINDNNYKVEVGHYFIDHVTQLNFSYEI